MFSQNSFSHLPQSPFTPRFNLHHCSSRTFNPSNPILSLSYLPSQKALTTPQYLPTLPSSTTSFGRMKSDKSIKYHNMEDKENIRTGSGELKSMELKGVKNVNEIESEFRKIMSEFETRKQELEKTFTSPFQVQNEQEISTNFVPQFSYNSNTDFYFGNNNFSNISPFESPDNSCYVIKEITEECNTSTAEDFNQDVSYGVSVIGQDGVEKQENDRDIWEKICDKKTESQRINHQTQRDDFYMNTFGNTPWTFLKTPQTTRSNKSQFSNQDYPFYIINLTLPDKTDQFVYYPSIPIPQFATSVIEKHGISEDFLPLICEIVERHVKKNRVE